MFTLSPTSTTPTFPRLLFCCVLYFLEPYSTPCDHSFLLLPVLCLSSLTVRLCTVLYLSCCLGFPLDCLLTFSLFNYRLTFSGRAQAAPRRTANVAYQAVDPTHMNSTGGQRGRMLR